MLSMFKKKKGNRKETKHKHMEPVSVKQALLN